MDSSKDRVVKIAKLSRLDLRSGLAGEEAENNLATFAAQFDDIVALMDTLAVIDTKDVAPLYWPLAAPATPPREDAVDRDNTREDVLRNAPEQDGQFFIVPRIV